VPRPAGGRAGGKPLAVQGAVPDLDLEPVLTLARLRSPAGAPSSVTLVPVIFAGPRPEFLRRSPAVPPTVKAVVSPRSGRAAYRLWVRAALASYTDTTSDATAITVAEIAMTVLAFIRDLHRCRGQVQ
jgi:hypothetical protein